MIVGHVIIATMSLQPEGINSKWLIDLILKSQNVNDVENVDLQFHSAVARGENYCSNTYRVTVKSQLSADKEKNVYAICKNAFTDSYADGFSEFFTTEFNVYSTVLPQMDNLMEEFSDAREKLWCKFYGHAGRATLVFEDLSELGFSSGERVNWLQEADASLIMKELARFHAMSRILLERDGFRKEDFKVNNMNTESEIWGKMFKGPLILWAETIEKFWGPDWKVIASSLKREVPLVCDKLTKLAVNYDRRFEVFNHGDMWTCNIMKKCGDSTGKTTSIRFIDFQQPCINSFIIDLVTFFHCSVDPSVRRNKIDDLFAVYANSLGENLRFFETKGYVPTIEDVKSEYKRIEYLAFVLCLALFPVTTDKTDQPLLVDKLFDHPADEIFDKIVLTDERIVRELKIDLKMFEHQLH